MPKRNLLNIHDSAFGRVNISAHFTGQVPNFPGRYAEHEAHSLMGITR